jgi:hypothetical protein
MPLPRTTAGTATLWTHPARVNATRGSARTYCKPATLNLWSRVRATPRSVAVAALTMGGIEILGRNGVEELAELLHFVLGLVLIGNLDAGFLEHGLGPED